VLFASNRELLHFLLELRGGFMNRRADGRGDFDHMFKRLFFNLWRSKFLDEGKPHMRRAKGFGVQKSQLALDAHSQRLACREH
jgi:hypothetical protein